ncbi:MAG: hypothetical protein KBC73_05030 [Burkholderiaceae bacterium]|nr:hypothetical protein [Burkholderiaceae bacterium]
MLKTLRRLLSRGSEPGGLSLLEAWAQERGHAFRRVRDAQGCAIDGRLGTQAWRIEWGASQRSYVEGFELRLITELNLPKELQVLVLNRALMEATERAVYEHYVDDVQTRIDTETPPEMRWLVMYQKLSAHDLGRLRERYGVVASLLPWAQQWLSSSLNDALAATVDPVPPEQPLTLTISRGRLTLRTAMADPDLPSLTMWMSVFEHGLREARRVAEEWRDVAGSGQTTQPSLWEHIGPTDPDEPTLRLPKKG